MVPITKKDADRASVMAAVDQLMAALKAAGIRAKVIAIFATATEGCGCALERVPPAVHATA